MSISSSAIHFVRREPIRRLVAVGRSTCSSSFERVRARKPSTRTRVSPHITTTWGPSIGTTTTTTTHRLRNRHRDASLSNSLSATRVLRVCVCLYDGIYGADDRVGSVLLLLPCHTVTRNGPSGARVTIFSSSSTKTRKKSLLSSVCVCVTDGLLSSEKSLRRFSDFPSLACVKSCSGTKTEQFFLRQTCGNLSPANWTWILRILLSRTSAIRVSIYSGRNKPTNLQRRKYHFL